VHWPGSSGASVAITAITDPAPGGTRQSMSRMGLSAAKAAPTGTPQTVSSAREPKLACTNAPIVHVSWP